MGGRVVYVGDNWDLVGFVVEYNCKKSVCEVDKKLLKGCFVYIVNIFL